MKNGAEVQVLTAAEAEVMNIIWDVGSASIVEVQDHLKRELAYTTVLTTVRILENKGFVELCGRRGRAFLYHAKVTRDVARRSMSKEVANRLFGGSIKSLVLNLMRGDAITSNDLADVKQHIEKLEVRG